MLAAHSNSSRAPITFATVMDAAFFGAERHATQRRKDIAATPYINHPLSLASLLATEAGIDDFIIICAVLLHDTIEDTDTTEDELRQRYGDEITDIVLELSDDKSLPKAVRKQYQIDHAAAKTLKAKIASLADKTCNLRDLAVSTPIGWTAERVDLYFDWAEKVGRQLMGQNPLLDALFEKALQGRPPMPA